MKPTTNIIIPTTDVDAIINNVNNALHQFQKTQDYKNYISAKERYEKMNDIKGLSQWLNVATICFAVIFSAIWGLEKIADDINKTIIITKYLTIGLLALTFAMFVMIIIINRIQFRMRKQYVPYMQKVNEFQYEHNIHHKHRLYKAFDSGDYQDLTCDNLTLSDLFGGGILRNIKKIQHFAEAGEAIALESPVRKGIIQGIKIGIYVNGYKYAEDTIYFTLTPEKFSQLTKTNNALDFSFLDDEYESQIHKEI